MTPKELIVGILFLLGDYPSSAFVGRFRSTGHETVLRATSARQKRISGLTEWGEANDIKAGGVGIQTMGEASGLGVVATQKVPTGSVVITVPSSVALSVEIPGGGPDDSGIKDLCSDRSAFRDLPWYVQFSLYLYKLDNVSSKKLGVDLQPWLDSLPRKFDTPIHWKNKASRDDWLQYPHMSESVDRQEASWTDLYKKLQACTTVPSMSWDDFVWGCECARSRAFSGGYTGSPFNPLTYAFTLLLVTVYVGLNLGTLEQAANGAGLVFSASILRDFVIPKFFDAEKYVICPIIDMCNHKSLGTTASVAYEFFSDAYSLSATVDSEKGSEVFISYGTRSNDQLYQYYGFVEPDNPHDVYIMPPLRDWDIGALEKACGAPFAAGRLGKLERAGLLGKAVGSDLGRSEDDGLEAAGNPRGGVVLTRVSGMDPAIVQALRALVSTESEWEAAGEAIGNFVNEISPENEKRALLAARTAVELEISSKATTLNEDIELLKRISSKPGTEVEEKLALQFRIEKKKVLEETLEKLR